MSEEAIACPFCGNISRSEFAIEVYTDVHYTKDNKKWEQTFYYHSCSCGARGPQCYSREEAIQKWNRRKLFNQCTEVLESKLLRPQPRIIKETLEECLTEIRRSKC